MGNPILSQTREGFYDTNNYDLRNLPGYDPEGNSLPDVAQPVVGTKPTLATPKNVKTAFDPIASIPGATFNPNNPLAATQTLNPQALLQGRNLVINPLTGEVNPSALQQQQQKARNKREAQKKLREEFDQEEIYQESRLRRASIIFFLTLPFALGVSAGAVALLPSAALQKGILGSSILFGGTIGLSATNVYLDQERLEKHRSEHKTLATSSP